MKELLRTNDAVLISFIESIMKEAQVEHVVLDTHMSVVDGSLGVLPRRIMVDDDSLRQARRLLDDLGIEYGTSS